MADSSKTDYIVGLDLGGTKILAGVCRALAQGSETLARVDSWIRAITS